MEKKKLIGFYDYTVILTYLGMILAFTGILCVMKELYFRSILCLIGAGVCDLFDGSVASTKNRNRYEKHFGIQIDSLSDLISFGVLPALFAYNICGKTTFTGAVACVFVLCGLIRLAYYNVQEFERQQATEESRECFLGVPITTSAILLPICYLIYDLTSLNSTIIFPALLIILAVGYVSGVEIKKPKLAGKCVMTALEHIEEHYER